MQLLKQIACLALAFTAIFGIAYGIVFLDERVVHRSGADAAYREGYTAQLGGGYRTSCPYTSYLHKTAWLRGFDARKHVNDKRPETPE